MEFNKIELTARKYANITHNKEIDDEERYYKDYQKYDGFIAGYEQAIEDSKAPEMFELLKKIRDEKVSEHYFEIEQLLTKITE